MFRYAQLVYEDLFSNPVTTLIKLYDELELPVDFFSIKALLRHIRDPPKGLQQNNDFYSIYRGENHNNQEWQTMMKKQDLTEIETQCSEILNLFGYAAK